ncbi:DegT/DnrJ/EryC1/StrS family aminotransferase [Lysinibacillus sp. 1 U-2021]|nr:DegT/DnrJ/EryC1/StrS family aminotransferase [Lysinibacillus sp. 1 U-2021]WGT41685.1 DegT/DnrJ/EryC1/StrS family aminotransferase [Lysinibacillus sp. 1 U-2021]
MIKFLDLKSINLKYEKEFHDLLQTFLESGWYINGSMVEEFEDKFAKYCGAKHCIGVSNGLDALKLILRAYDIGPGDEVIVPANTYIATILAITQVGATPVFVEPDARTFNITLANIKLAITNKTKAVMVVHLYGRIVTEIEEIKDFCEKNALKLFEDAAQAHGAAINGRKAGSFGNAAAFSFYPGKNLGALGDAGAITTDDVNFAKKLIALRNYGSFVKYENLYQGYNNRLDEIQAAFLILKLKDLDEDNLIRNKLATIYLEEINNPLVTLPASSKSNENVWHVFPILVKERSKFIKYMKENGVETLIHYPIPPHKQKAYKEFNNLKLEVTEDIHENIVSLPISPVHTHEEITAIIKITNNYKF